MAVEQCALAWPGITHQWDPFASTPQPCLRTTMQSCQPWRMVAPQPRAYRRSSAGAGSRQHLLSPEGSLKPVIPKSLRPPSALPHARWPWAAVGDRTNTRVVRDAANGCRKWLAPGRAAKAAGSVGSQEGPRWQRAAGNRGCGGGRGPVVVVPAVSGSGSGPTDGRAGVDSSGIASEVERKGREPTGAQGEGVGRAAQGETAPIGGRSKRRIISRSVDSLGEAIVHAPDALAAIPHKVHSFASEVVAALAASASGVRHWTMTAPLWQRPLRVAVVAALLLPPLLSPSLRVLRAAVAVVNLPVFVPDALSRLALATSWALVFWPHITAIGLGVAALRSLYRGVKTHAKSSIEMQIVELLAGLAWLILVPAGIFLGTPDGWPLTLFVSYLLFFGMSAGTRFIERRKFETGENPRLGIAALSPREIDAQWATAPRRAAQILFILGLGAGHWLAMAEALFHEHMVQLAPAWARWLTGLAAVVVMQRALAMNLEASEELGIFYDRLVVPKYLVTTGPYRTVRHPIYMSYILLFAGYTIAMNAPLSMILLTGTCYWYYEQRTAIEEELLQSKFGEEYEMYKKNTNKYFDKW